MNYILKNAQVAFPNEIKQVDIRFEDEKITEIGRNLKGLNIIDCSNKLITPTLVDLHVHTRTPGFEYKEDIQSLTKAALMGGFCDVIAMPNLNPTPNDTPTLENIQKLIKQNSKINIIQSAAITQNRNNQVLNDLNSLKTRTNFISDDGSGIENNTLMYNALKKAKDLNLTMLIHPEFLEFVNNGSISECDFAKKHNIKEILPIAEELMIGRDLILNNKINAKLHFCHISTKQGAELILKLGLKNTTFEIAPHHLVLSTHDLKNKGNFKMNPPLRSIEDVSYLVNLLATNPNMIIATDHAPHSFNEKNTNLEDALFGIIGLESCFALLYTKLVLTKKVPLLNLVRALTINPGKIIGVEREIKVGNEASLCVIDINNVKIFDEKCIGSKSKNTPFIGENLTGFVTQTFYKGKKIYEVSDEI